VKSESPSGHVSKKRRIKSVKRGGKQHPRSLELSDEILLLRGMMSQLQGKIDEINQVENVNCFTGCYNEYLEWFDVCNGGDDGSSVTKMSSNDSESNDGDFPLREKNPNGRLYLV
jgi:hypothetical protein